eukprot:SAG22_NODE_6837_length_805_cov_2.988669_1_plen_104_part_10
MVDRQNDTQTGLYNKQKKELREFRDYVHSDLHSDLQRRFKDQQQEFESKYKRQADAHKDRVDALSAKVDSLEGKGESKSELTASQIAIKAEAQARQMFKRQQRA